jgi:hypothetical protein
VSVPIAAVVGVALALHATWPAAARGAAGRDHPPAAVAPHHGLAAWIDIFDAGP